MEQHDDEVLDFIQCFQQQLHRGFLDSRAFPGNTFGGGIGSMNFGAEAACRAHECAGRPAARIRRRGGTFGPLMTKGAVRERFVSATRETSVGARSTRPCGQPGPQDPGSR
jgi:hypothetical protein